MTCIYVCRRLLHTVNSSGIYDEFVYKQTATASWYLLGYLSIFSKTFKNSQVIENYKRTSLI